MTVVVAPVVDVAEVRALFVEYAASLGFSLESQGFGAELASLPGAYVPPTGGVWVAHVDGAAAGCVAIRASAPGIGELKRLYVRPAFRGRGLGRALAEVALEGARALGYGRLRLDTITSQMGEAMALYRALGFVEVPAYAPSAIPGTAWFELALG